MVFGQVEEGMDQELGMLWWRSYWDGVYLNEEKRWESGEEFEEVSDAEVNQEILEIHPLVRCNCF